MGERKPRWEVRSSTDPVLMGFGADYFPRKFWYKWEAQRLVDEVIRKGGSAHLVDLWKEPK